MQQLKEILAKQAELGVEVAEIPGCSLPDPRKQGQGREENGRPFAKKGRFRNKFDKRGRNDNRDRHPKRQRLNDNGSSTVSVSNRTQPTLLQKLLSADIKRDKIRLLQAFRFMVMNSFFKDWPDKPLKLPSVIVKEGSVEEDENDIVPNSGKGDLEHTDKTVLGKFDNADHSDDDNDGGEDGSKNSDESECDKQVDVEEEEEEEEGEIIN